MKNIILIGFMGAGKSSVGKCLARLVDYKFLDTDSLIEDITGFKIIEIFDIFGEKYFRNLENKLIHNFIDKNYSSFIISTGGGLPCYLKEKYILKKLGIVIYLKNLKKVLLNRIKDDKSRPLRFISNLYEQRQHCYNSIADIVISCETLSIEEIAAKIMLTIKNKELL